ncbi:MAG TPA: trypsin-like peptidase domain-containing protein [Polyangiaceae bacterium]
MLSFRSKAALLALVSTTTLACGGSTTTAQSAAETSARPSAHDVYLKVAPSVVAVLNDDRADREEEIVQAEKSMGQEAHAPKHTIDVSLRKDPQPDGTGFIIPSGEIVTAAHVVQRPDRLKITTHDGQTVAADLVHFDVVRDIAVLKPREALKNTKPIALADHELDVGERVWAFGHTGRGFWELSWGMSEGISSGNVDMFDARLVLFDAPIFPGFSGGPVVALDSSGTPRVVGIDHAILFTGMAGLFSPTGPISSAVSVSELKAVEANKPAPAQAAVAAYAKTQRGRVYADLFVTDRVLVGRDENGQPVASLMGNAKVIVADPKDTVVPAVAMLFGLPKGRQEVQFELHDPDGKTVATTSRHAHVRENQRVAFAKTELHFAAKTTGPYEVVAKFGGKELGKSRIALAVSGGDDDEVPMMGDADEIDENGDPDVDVVVAQASNDDPLLLQGIHAAWTERSYPRRVDFNWYARASRGWSGTNVAVGAYVLDDKGQIVGRAEGCFLPEVRPEKSWDCAGSVSEVDSPLPQAEGRYDIVFTVNDRPVAWWPMEATLKKAAALDGAGWSKDQPTINATKAGADDDDDAAPTKDGKPGKPGKSPKAPATPDSTKKKP